MWEQKALAVFAACAFNACSAASWNALDALSSESFPLPVRVTSMGMLGSVRGRQAGRVERGC